MSRLLKPHNSARPDFNSDWAKIKPIVLALLRQKPVSKDDWQGLFFLVHSLNSWIDDGAQKIVQELNKEIDNYVIDANKRICYHKDESTLLRSYIVEWNKFFDQARYLPMPFQAIEGSLNRGNIPNVIPKSSITSTNSSPSGADSTVRRNMLDSWHKHVFVNIRDSLLKAALNLVAIERNGETFDAKLVVGVRESFVYLSVKGPDGLEDYRRLFEAQYIEATRAFYNARTSQILSHSGVQTYMIYAYTKLREEEERALRYLDTNQEQSLTNLTKCCVQALVSNYQDQILAECSTLIQDNDIDKLRMMFRLMNRTRTGIDPMLKCVNKFIREQGLQDMAVNADAITTDPEKYVEQLLSMFTQYSCLIHDAFYDDARFLTTRDKAFQEVVNDTSVFRIEMPASKTKCGAAKLAPESRCPELLATYCDLLLRKTPLSRRLTQDEIEQRLSDVCLVLKYVSNKDVFMRYHKMHLSRRLILDLSADQEKEETMINRLREAGMPSDYVNKLLRMLQDIEINKDYNKRFRSELFTSNNNRNTIADTVNIKILNAGAWSRGGERVPVSLPPEIEEILPQIDEFYKKQHIGRKLHWLHHWSNGTIQMASRVGMYDLEVTTFQMAILYVFNDRRNDKLSLDDLRISSVLPDLELRRTLVSLVAFPKLRQQILLTDGDPQRPQEWTDSTLFWINHAFSIYKNNKLQLRGRINVIGRLQLQSATTAVFNREQLHDDIVQLRTLRVQEAIVKIMKSRKMVQSALLQTELVEMLKHMFYPSRRLIKEQIDWLIEHEYIRRDQDDNHCFIYT